ncbi:MAG: SpoIID/LytB domain-containing protein [Bacillota bacterium]|nr:SpoIID/LytB domain-containing protein [Bacillota bacterium]
MKYRSKSKLISIIIIVSLIFVNPLKVQASVSSDIYVKPISIGFTSMGKINTIDFTVNDSYFIPNHEITLKSGSNYRIQLSSNNFEFYENGNLLFITTDDIKILPINYNSYIKFSKMKYGVLKTCYFPGNMIFKNTDGYLVPINSLQMEDYVRGVVPYESPESYNIEALKAQAVAARTYAVKNKGKNLSKGYDLQDNTYDQVYDGINLDSNLNDLSPKCSLAVLNTKGIVLTYNSNPIDAFYSCSNGGYSEAVQNVWNSTPVPYLVSVQDPFDNNNKWTSTKSNSDIDALLKKKHPELNISSFSSIDIGNIQKYESGRIKYLPINYIDNQGSSKTFTIGKDVPQSEAITLFGFNSSLYNISYTNGLYTFNGKGNGHGLGMSQEGANARANSSQNYKTILNFYYPNSIEENANITTNIASFKIRIGGKDRFSTSRLIAESLNNDYINNVVVATGFDYPDALAGSVLAKKLNAPILLTAGSPEESNDAITYIKNHLNKDGTIYILGGQGVVSESFQTKFKELGFNNITRLGGTNRQDTAVKIADKINSDASTLPVVIATQNNFPDALSISPVAALKGYPLLLSGKDSLGDEVKKYLIANKPSKVYIAGGTGVISDQVKNEIKSTLGYGDDSVLRFGGKDRYETSRIINSELFTNPDEVMVATGMDFPDALTGSVYAADKNSPIILADDNSSQEAENYIKYLGINSKNVQISVFGLQGAVSDNVINNLIKITR